MSDLRSLKITFVCGAERPSGGQRVISIYADRLTKRGHDVTIVVPRHRSPTFRHRAFSIFRQRWGLSRNDQHGFSFLRGTSFNVIRLDHTGPVTDHDVPDADVVIASWWEVVEWVAALRPSKGAKVHFIQGYEVYDYLPAARVEATYRLPFHKIVISQWLEKMINRLSDDTIIDFVPNSIDRAQFFAPKRGKQLVPCVGFLYSTSHTKGVDLTLSALRIVREKVPSLRLLSFGIIPPSKKLPLLAGTEYACSPPQSQLRAIYSLCDAWITASRSEGFNLTALEAMACRTPVIATKTGWPADAVKTSFNGVLVDVSDVQGLVDGLEWVLTRTDDEWRQLSENAYATASAGSWEESTSLFERALVHACVRGQRGELLAP